MNKLDDILELYGLTAIASIDDKGLDKGKIEAKQAIQQLIDEEVAKARIEETSLWYNEWGNGKEQIGDGSWEDYYDYRIATLNGVNNNE